MSSSNLSLRSFVYFASFASLLRNRVRVPFAKLGLIEVTKNVTSKDINSLSLLIQMSLTLSENCMEDLIE